jgi:hypothetical protein
MKRLAILVAVLTMAVGALFAGQAGAAGGNGASYCSLAAQGDNPGHYVTSHGVPISLALLCNPLVGEIP